MTTDEARAFVLKTVCAGPPVTAGDLLRMARLMGYVGPATYRAIDRALQYHRRAGRIVYRDLAWSKPGRRATRTKR